MTATIWERMAAPLASGSISWRQDGKPTERQGKWFARFVCYVEAGTVRERLDSIVPGEWDLTLELLPASPYQSEDDATVNFKARLQILGVIREDVGTGRDYKSASTDAFKRAAVRFGIGHELYAFEQNWVQVDGDSKFAKAVEDPQKAYERRHGSGAEQEGDGAVKATAQPSGTGQLKPASPASMLASTLADATLVACPKCGGKTWDNRLTKRNAKAPDYKCQNRSCDGVIWPPKDKAPKETPGPSRRIDDDDIRGSLEAVDEDDREPLPF